MLSLLLSVFIRLQAQSRHEKTVYREGLRTEKKYSCEILKGELNNDVSHNVVFSCLFVRCVVIVKSCSA